MEETEGYGRRRDRSRSSRRRNASSGSSLSFRLDPDFDPRLYHKNDLDLHEKRLNLHDSDQELDPMTMEFETLVGFLHPTFIYDYLKKILQFLNSNNNELCFPNIAQYKETFLVKIVNDNQRLMCAVFNEPCRVLGAQILRVIEDNRNVYRWIHVYESGRVTKNVLVYKKMFYNERKSTISQHNPTQESNTRKSNSSDEPKRLSLAPALLASKFEDLGLNPNQKQNQPKTYQLIRSSLKITFLNSTMKFLKQDNQLSLEYRQMTVEQAEYFDSVIRQYDTVTDVGFGYESLYAPLYKQLKEVADIFEFKITRNIVAEDAVRMSLRKIPKDRTRDVKHTERNYPQETPTRPPPSRITPPAGNFKEPTPRHNDKYLSKARVIDALPVGFVQTSLERILEFIDDDKRASLEFGKLTADESSFVQLIVNLSRNISAYTSLFSEETVIAFKKIFRMLKYETQQKKRWRLNVNVGRLDRNKLGNVVFEKIPMMNTTKSRISQQTCGIRSTTDSSRSRDVSKDRSVPDIAQRLMELSTKDVGQISTSSRDVSQTATPTSTSTSTRDVSAASVTSLDSNVPAIAKRLIELSTRDISSTSLDHSTERLRLGFSKGNNSHEGRSKSLSKDRSRTDRSLSRGRKRLNNKERRKASKYAITFQSAGEQIIDTMSLSTTAGDSCQTDVRVTRQFGSGRKQRLMDDLSTPVEIDKAKRMMEQMGWDGGPLGARGEGIIEPIMPAIHLAPGAGLGHIKAQSHSTAEFRVKFLTSLLKFITGTETDASVSFEQALTKREMRFLAPTVKSINKRKLLGLKLEEMDVLNRILDEIISQPTLLIECEVVNDNREIRIYKIVGDPSKIKIGNRKKGLASTSNRTNIPILQHIQDQNTEIITTDEVLNTDLGIHCSSQKGYRRIAEKVIFLEKINDFLQIPDEKKEYLCDFILNTKQREYIHQVVTVINKRDDKHTFGTVPENYVYCDIMRNVKNCYMTVIFSTQKFTLHKRYYQKRFTNSSTIATPVSKDEKNTIIYDNNTVKRLSDDKTEEKGKNCEENYKKHDKNISVNRQNDDNDYLTLSDQDDILIIDDADLEDLESDSGSDKSDSKDTDDEYKDLESDCEEIPDISDDSMLLELLEKENEACAVHIDIDSCIVLDIVSGDSSDNDDSIDESNADTSKLDKATADEKNSVKKDSNLMEKLSKSVKNKSSLTKDLSELDEVKIAKNSLFESESKPISHEINVKPSNMETSTPKRLIEKLEIQSDFIVFDGNDKLKENVKNEDSNTLRDEKLGSANKGSITKDSLLEDSISQENVDLLDTSIDEISLTPPLIAKKEETHKKYKEEHTDIEDINDYEDEFHSKYSETQDISEEYLTPRNSIENLEEIGTPDLKVNADLEISGNSDQFINKENEKCVGNIEFNKLSYTPPASPNHMRKSPTTMIYDKTEYRDIKFNKTDISKDVDKNDSKTSEVNNNFGNDKKNVFREENRTKNDQSEIKMTEENEACQNGSQSEIKMAEENEICQNGATKYGENHFLKRAISKDSILLESSPSSSKRSRTDSENSDKISKKYKNSMPLSVYITRGDPDDIIGIENARIIQKIISENINIYDTKSLPLLECQGLQNGGLIYNCYTDESLTWLKKIISDNTDFHIEILDNDISELKSYTLKMKVNSYIEEKNEEILNRIELYNTGLNIYNWVVIDRKVSDSFIVLTVQMDEESYKYVCENYFNLFAGVTRAQFYPIWD